MEQRDTKKTMEEGEVREHVLEAVRKAAPEGRLTCQAAHLLAEEIQVSLLEIGRAAERLQIKIKACQLGCF